jgi:hypothetical protein
LQIEGYETICDNVTSNELLVITLCCIPVQDVITGNDNIWQYMTTGEVDGRKEKTDTNA